MNNNYIRSILAGFIATVALSILMILKGIMGMMPQLNVIHMLAGMAHKQMGLAASPVVGWLGHFFIGTVVWGIAFALLYQVLPGKTALAKGLAFSVLAWLLMMLLPMPMAGAGLFGLKLGIMAPVMTLVLHLIWGAVLGLSYAALTPREGARG
ncbi:DUF6789 family protein [Oleiagrimonas sp.]|jgi:uncharacterized membrane protein YagU involved in acid resistance|uniref:DUF6789 family protein n=1 Tax=Oleiagrimonas sp. TaxID=2010330 RepID=UPI002627B47B|nr:DUF6789 family protein [Oleiagrimonas sp.]MDA3914059.1 hypothetical protein [Oleiagrimonas sp.]